MLNPSKRNLSVNTMGSKFDRKTFVASSLFFFAALVNPRDFPIANVPLIYPAFLVFILIMGVSNLREGLRRTRFLSLLIITYWSYFHLLRYIDGRAFTLEALAYLIEPLLILCAVGMATIHTGGTKATLWSLVFVIILSTVSGLWIYFIGEPFESIRLSLKSSIEGNVLQSEFMSDVDVAADLFPVKQNSGLSSQVFSFSYQLAVAILIITTALLSKNRSVRMKYLSLAVALVILLAGMITNTERATLLSVSLGLFSFFLIQGKKLIDFRMIGVLILCIIMTMALFNYSSGLEERQTLHNRKLVSEETYNRIYFMPKTAFESIFHEPFGIGRTTPYYISVAYRVGWAGPNGPVAPHNHFANVIMYTGFIGILLTILLFWNLWKKIRKIRYFQLSASSVEEVILAAACVTMIIHSLTHNAGFFKLEPSTLIVFGLLWGSTAKDKYPTYNNLLKRWIIE